MWSEGVIVLLQRLWEWQGLVQREERAPPLRKVGVVVRFGKGWCGARGRDYLFLLV